MVGTLDPRRIKIKRDRKATKKTTKPVDELQSRKLPEQLRNRVIDVLLDLLKTKQLQKFRVNNQERTSFTLTSYIDDRLLVRQLEISKAKRSKFRIRQDQTADKFILELSWQTKSSTICRAIVNLFK